MDCERWRMCSSQTTSRLKTASSLGDGQFYKRPAHWAAVAGLQWMDAACRRRCSTLLINTESPAPRGSLLFTLLVSIKCSLLWHQEVIGNTLCLRWKDCHKRICSGEQTRKRNRQRCDCYRLLSLALYSANTVAHPLPFWIWSVISGLLNTNIVCTPSKAIYNDRAGYM